MNLARLAFISATLAPFSLSAATAATASAPPAKDLAENSTLTTLRIKAEQGDASAQYDLGVAYAQGRQTPRDLVEAFAWLTFAAERGAPGGALESVVSGLQPAQVAQTRRRLEALRAAYPSLRAPASPPPTPAPAAGGGATPIIAAPSTRATSAPVIVVPPSDPTPATDPRKLQELLTAAESQLRETQASLARQSTELATRRAEAAAARIDLDRLRAQLATAMETRAPAATSDAAALLERERTARMALERDLATRTAVAERAQAFSADEAKKLNARAAELSSNADTLARDLAQARKDLESSRQALDTATTKAAIDSSQHSRQMSVLEAKLSIANRDLTQTKETLATTATTTTASAVAQAETARQAEIRLAAVRTEVSALERDLQTGKAAAERSAAAKSASDTALNAANEKIAESTRELAALRQQMDASQRQLSSTTDQKVAALQSELNDTRARVAAAEKSAADRAAELAGLRTALAAAEARPKISPADLDTARSEAADARKQLSGATQELTMLRSQSGTVRDLEARIRQLEAEKATAPLAAAASDTSVGKEEFTRVTAARSEAENKLSTALRSYTLMARERDELRARVAELSARSPGVADASAAPVTTPAAPIARDTPPERVPDSVRADVERAPAPTVAARSGVSQPTRPTAAASRPMRTHTISAGETLTSLSLRYYGNAARWPEILAANRDVLPNERSFVAGLTLRIP